MSTSIMPNYDSMTNIEQSNIDDVFEQVYKYSENMGYPRIKTGVTAERLLEALATYYIECLRK